MKTNITKIGAVLLAVGICACNTNVRAQATATVTRGAFTEFVPGSETVVVKSETNPAPLRYVVTKQTVVVDDSGNPVAIERIAPGSPLSVQYATTGDQLVASRIVVQPATVAAPGNVIQERTTTTTTQSMPLTHEEKEALEKRREHLKHAEKERIEKQEKALEKAKDDDDGDGH